MSKWKEKSSVRAQSAARAIIYILQEAAVCALWILQSGRSCSSMRCCMSWHCFCDWYFYCFCVTNTSGSQTVLGIRVICTYFLKYRCLIFIFGLQNQNSNDCPVVILKQAGGCWFKGGPGGFDTLLKDQRLSKKGFKFESSIFSHGMLGMNWNPQPQFPYLYVGANKPAEGADIWINYNLCTSYLNPVYKVETVTITIILMYSDIF